MLKNTLISTVAALALLGGMIGVVNAEPVAVRIVIKDVLTTNPEDMAHMERIEAAMAKNGHEIDIQVVNLPSSGYADKLKLMLLSGDVPDLIYFQGGDEHMADQGLLEDLQPWIAKTEYLQKALWPHNVERLKNYPYLLYAYAARSKAPLIRTDWLEKTGLGVPNTLDEFTALLKAISVSDFDGDGVKNTFGIMAPGNTKELDAIFNQAFGITGTWMQNNGEWVDARVSDEERAKLTYYRMLFAEGILDPEFITKNWEVKEDDLYAGRVGVVMGTAGPVVGIYSEKIRQVHPGTELTLLLPPKGVAQGLQATNVSKESRGLALSSISENKEMVMELLDFLASPEGQMMERMGFEGTHYSQDGDTITINDALGSWYPRFMVANPNAWTPPVNLLSPIAQASLDQGVRFFSADNSFVFPAELAVDVDAAENFYRTAVYRFVSGETSLDEWDNYVAEFNANGGAKLVAHARKVLK